MVPGVVVDLFMHKASPTRAIKALSFIEEEDTSIKASWTTQRFRPPQKPFWRQNIIKRQLFAVFFQKNLKVCQKAPI